MRCQQLLMLCGVAAALSGCKDSTPPPENRRRPVTVIVLGKTNPVSRLRLTGSAESWKQEKVGFEVSGRVRTVVDAGIEVVGRGFDENGRLISEGDVLATIDPQRYAQRKASAAAQSAAAKANVKAAKVEIEEVLPKNLDAARADAKYKELDLDKKRKAKNSGVATELEVALAESAYKVADAKVKEIQATIRTKESELAALDARVLQAIETQKQAALDFDNCTLRAPFRGRVSEVHVIRGAYVRPGQAVATLVVMDPLKIELAVSPATDWRLNEGDPVLIYPPGRDDEPVRGNVHTKATVADARTRTFKVTIFTRNRQVPAELPTDEDIAVLQKCSYVREALKTDTPAHGLLRSRIADAEAEIRRLRADQAKTKDAAQRRAALEAAVGTMKTVLQAMLAGKAVAAEHVRALQTSRFGRERLADIAGIQDPMPVLRFSAGGGPLAMDVRCIDVDPGDGRPFVWRLEGGREMIEARRRFKAVVRLRKVHVQLTEKRRAFLGMYVFRAMAPTTDLRENDLLAIKDGLPKGIRDGEAVLLLRKRWLFRPGDLVPVLLEGPGPGEGFYVPMKAILHENGRHCVYVVTAGAGGGKVARRVGVTLRGAIGEMQRIEGDRIGDGTQVVLHGVAYLTPDEGVNVIEVKKVQP